MAITTNREYLAAALTKFGLTDNDIDLIMVEHPDLSGSLDVKACKLAMYNSMSLILPTANVSDSGYSISWNIDALKIWYTSLCSELGKTNAIRPKIRNRSYYW